MRNINSVSIIVPVYNESPTLNDIIVRLDELKFGNMRKECIFVDDGSTDSSRSILNTCKDKIGFHVVYHDKNKGKGAALRTGYEYATGGIVAVQDADLEYNPQEIKKLIEPIIIGDADVVYGSRMTGNNPIGYWYMYLGNYIVSLVARVLYGKKLTDIETCYKVFKKDILDSIHLESDGFGIEAEFTAKVLRSGYRIMEMPISYTPRGYEEGKKISWKDGVSAVWLLIKYRVQKKNSS